MDGLRDFFGGIDLSAAALAAGVLVGAALIDLVARLLVRFRVRRAAMNALESGTDDDTRKALRRGTRSAVAPLELLLWVVAIHWAVRLLSPGLRDRGAADLALTSVDLLLQIGAVVAFVWLMARLGRIVETWICDSLTGSGQAWGDVAAPLIARTIGFSLPLIALIVGVRALPVAGTMQRLLGQGLAIILVAAIAWLLTQLVLTAERAVLRRYRIDAPDNLEARAIYTQVTMLRKVALVVIGIFTLASMLMVFETVRRLGTTILASAGVAGVIVGFAAQRSIATLLAGFQIAITQPIRVDDVLIVEGEWGRVEDINLTFVVVRIWDLRRLVLPITYFMEKPFQNWTRRSADLLAPVYLYLDYDVPLAALRVEFDRVLEASRLWDRKVKVLQVSDAKEHTIEVRALASAPDASTAWDLRCEVREALIVFLQRNYPRSLPRLRVHDVRPAAD